AQQGRTAASSLKSNTATHPIGSVCCPLKVETDPPGEAVVAGVAYPKDRGVIDEGGAVAGELQPEADAVIDIVPRGRRPRQDKARKQARVVAVGDRDRSIARVVLVRPVKATDRIERTDRRGEGVLRIGAEEGDDRVHRRAAKRQVRPERAVLAK